MEIPSDFLGILYPSIEIPIIAPVAFKVTLCSKNLTIHLNSQKW